MRSNLNGSSNFTVSTSVHSGLFTADISRNGNIGNVCMITRIELTNDALIMDVYDRNGYQHQHIPLMCLIDLIVPDQSGSDVHFIVDQGAAANKPITTNRPETRRPHVHQILAHDGDNSRAHH